MPAKRHRKKPAAPPQKAAPPKKSRPAKKPIVAKNPMVAKEAVQSRRPTLKLRAARPPDDITTKGILLEAAAKVGDAEVRQVIEEAEGITRKAATGGALDVLLPDIQTLLSLLRDYAAGTYRDVPFGAIATVTGALRYVLSPVDLIPDFIPVIGLADDAAVVAACLKLVAYEVAKYRDWKAT